MSHPIRILALLILILLLTGCAFRSLLPEPEITSEAASDTFLVIPDTTAPAASADSAATEPEPTAPPVTTTPQLPPPIISPETTPPTPAWDPSRAAAFPADAACSPAELLGKWMTVEGLTEADLSARGCDQMILIAAQPGEGSHTLVCCYEREENHLWQPVPGLTGRAGTLGKNGLAHDRRRDTLTSPAGLWALGMAFGNSPKPEGTAMPWRDVTPSSDWVCDENSPYFNTWQERGDPNLEPWSDDVEHLEDYPAQYAYACVIEYNTPPGPVLPDRGCAIFLHCSTGPTAGCVGLPEPDMLAVLRWLDPEKNPHILITGYEGG